jgi:hypothetical protein
MSALLDSLLGADRLACCRAHDAIAFQPKDSGHETPDPDGPCLR